MASISRSSLRHIVRHQRGKITQHQQAVSLFSTSTILADEDDEVRNFSTRTLPQTLQSNHKYSEIDLLNMKKTAKTDLLQALENIVEVQKALGASTGLMVTGSQDCKELEAEVESWKDSINAALIAKDIRLALDLFYSAPDSVTTAKDTSVLFVYRNILNRIPAKDAKTIFDISEAAEKMYANIQEHSDGHSALRIENCRFSVLRKMVKAISVAPQSVPFDRLSQVLKDLASTIECITEPNVQHELYPLLMKSFLCKPMSVLVSRSLSLQELEKEIWDSAIYSLRMMDRDVVSENPICFQLYNNVLAQSTFRKQKDLPFVFMMKSLVDKGATPSPEVALNIVQNEYPYESIYKARAILKGISKLQRNKPAYMPDYILDMGTLEHFTCVLSRKGNSREMMMLWDYIQDVQLAGNPSYHATEGLYESLARAFVSSNRKEDEYLFGVLATMEDQGLKPSFIFIRGLSQAMRTRSTVGRLDKASHILISSHRAQRYNNTDTVVRATTSALNTIISGYADLGLFEKAYTMYGYFKNLNCEPDEHTFVFMLEAVAMNLSTAIPRRQDFRHEWVSAQEEAADLLIEEAGYRGYLTNKFLVDSYVKILCTTNSMEKAKNFIADTVHAAEQNGMRPNIAVKTFSTLAVDFALSGDQEGVEEISQLCTMSGYKGLPSHVMERIERIRTSKL